jgi:AraC-like DNA-binding protein
MYKTAYGLPPPPPPHIFYDNDIDIIPNIGYLVYRECTPSWVIRDRLHRFDWWDITYVVGGGSLYTIDGITYELTAGDLLCLPPGHSRLARTTAANPMRCFAANFGLANQSSPEQPVIPLPLISHIGLHEDIIHIFHEMVFIWIERPPLYKFKIRSMFMDILHRFFDLVIFDINTSVADSRIKKITRYISAHYAEKISVKKMAAMVGLHPVYLGALFKEETGITLNRYLIKVRIRNAENMLRSGEFRVNEVADLCGYTDNLYFYRQFKEICGFPPSDYFPKKETTSRIYR